MENNLIKKQIDNSTSKYIHPIELYALNFHFHTESEHSFIELANENEEQFAVKYLSEQSVKEMLAEKDREIEVTESMRKNLLVDIAELKDKIERLKSEVNLLEINNHRNI